ncbi:MAG: hypothetical protein A2W80_02320 [Candidatus Riflebacteria bacterium GWC2_50_8]|nr:MAG: hypothetical protein A2W80_02320 [Candidatus Riflebacteria bacterium GWC2_50_8]
MPPVRSQNLSIMLTDIQGYSTTTANSSREEVVSLIRRHNQLMRPVIEFYGGTIVKSIGDAFLCTFGSATDAVICAIIIQLLLKEYNQRLKEGANQLNLRVVINSGDVSLEENDIFGNAVNVTARMEALECFPGGSIGISESTYLLMDRNEIIAEKIGPQKLKGVPDPVTVFSIPFDKQKLNQLPVQLLALVEKVINAKEGDPGSVAAAQINEWKQSVGKFLKQTNWGDNINKASEQIGKVQKSLTKTFGQKTVLEKNQQLKDASMLSRIKSGIIDWVILLVAMTVLSMAWWPVQRIVYGPTQSVEQFSENINNWRTELIGGKYVMVRNQGIIESFVSLNIQYPLPLFWLYFTLFWKIKKATPGQIASGTAVVDEGGSDISFGRAAKRSALFLVSSFIIVGLAMVFVGEKKTLYDKVCNTRVVE